MANENMQSLEQLLCRAGVYLYNLERYCPVVWAINLEGWVRYHLKEHSECHGLSSTSAPILAPCMAIRPQGSHHGAWNHSSWLPAASRPEPIPSKILLIVEHLMHSRTANPRKPCHLATVIDVPASCSADCQIPPSVRDISRHLHQQAAISSVVCLFFDTIAVLTDSIHHLASLLNDVALGLCSFFFTMQQLITRNFFDYGPAPASSCYRLLANLYRLLKGIRPFVIGLTQNVMKRSTALPHLSLRR